MKLDAVLCARVYDSPVAATESIERSCDRCGERVWLSKYNVRFADRGVPLICTRCIGLYEKREDGHD